ncbi:MAG: hypothetical protein C4575_14185 [Desulforudis sp.]|nr:MAG: hypothetical protein C4575_14185 [Desulforudis sp.]
MNTNEKGWINLITINQDAEIMRHRDRTKVLKIQGGWLCKFHHFQGASSSMTAQAMTFIPDPQHEWNPLEGQAAWERIDQKKNPNFCEYTDRIKVINGWVYKNLFFIKTGEMHISLVYVPGQ